MGDDKQQLEEKKRTIQQNKALHLFFDVLAEQLNEAGLDMKKVLKPEIEISWTKYNVKEYIWKPIQEALYGKTSTTQLFKSQEIDKIYDIINRHLAKYGFETPQFPDAKIIEDYEELVKIDTKYEK